MCKFCENRLEDGLRVADKAISIGALGNIYFGQDWFETKDPKYPWRIASNIAGPNNEVIYSQSFAIKFCPFCGRDLRKESK